MPTFTIKYMEMRTRQWLINFEAKSLEEAEQLSEEYDGDPCRMVVDEKATWAVGSNNEEVGATVELETIWELEKEE